jgi:predicted acetyltransferase
METRTHDKGRAHRRELVVEDQVVSWLYVIDYPMRVGSAVVRMAGIGGVESKPEHRMQGHMRRLFDDTVRYMTEQGYDVSMLFGIPNFYTKFGYAVCLPSSQVTIQTRDAESAQAGAPPCAVRPLEPADLPKVIDLYNRNNAARTCSLVRSAEYFTSFAKGSWWGQPAQALVLEDHGGRFLGYAVWDKADDRVTVTEAEIQPGDERCYTAVLFEFARQAIDKRCGSITLHLPVDHPFAEYVQRFGCEWTIRHPRHGDAMMRILNQASLFHKLEPELVRRAAVASLPPGTLSIATDLGATALTVGQGALGIDDAAGEAGASLSLAQDKLMQMMAGYRSAGDVLNDPGVEARGDVQPFLDALFPKHTAYIWLADHF